MANRIIGIMGAMHEEIESILSLIEERVETVIGNRTFHQGTIQDISVVVVFSKWGKVAAAMTATSLILKFGITELLFVGVAGAIKAELKIGDIVIADQLLQHDLDARPFIARHEIPLLNTTYLETDPEMRLKAQESISSLLEGEYFRAMLGDGDFNEFLSGLPRVFTGTIASGDRFVATTADHLELQQRLPDTFCVEMEGAAVAQVCYEYQIPFLVIRTISDEAGDQSAIDFPKFIESVVQKYAKEVVRSFLAAKR